MSRVYVFGDEAGDFTFERKPGASRYFMIGTVTMGECSIGEQLLALRRELAWDGIHLDQFHASGDKQGVRDKVFAVIAAATRDDLRIDATILDKTKTYPRIADNPLYFYKLAWFMHLKYVAPRVCRTADELLVVASALQIWKKKQAVKQAVAEVVQQVSPTVKYHATFFPAATDPCLQVADYATWAIQRKWEGNDSRSYDPIRHLVRSTFEPYAIGVATG
jgi:hypothetical protein